MKFSIIVPVYNVEKYLTECLESIISQIYLDYEVICINDASKDKSSKILLEYAERYEKITIINNTENRGLSYSRNVGLKAAVGEYIVFVDSDDYIKEDTLSKFARALENKSVDILNFNYDMLFETVNNEDERINPPYNTFNIPISGQQWYCQSRKDRTYTPMACNKVFRRGFLLDNNLFFYESLLHEDELYAIQTLFHAKNVMNIEESLYVYRKRDNSITMSRQTTKRLDSFVVITYQTFLLWKKCESEEMKDILANHIKWFLTNVYQLLQIFPNHKILEMGGHDEQLFFDKLLLSKMELEYNFVHLNKKELDQIKKFEKRIIYGAGAVAKELLAYLCMNEIENMLVAVSNKKQNAKEILGCKIFQIDELLEHRNDALVIVAVANKIQNEIRDYLYKLGFQNVMLINTQKLYIEDWINKDT